MAKVIQSRCPAMASVIAGTIIASPIVTTKMPMMNRMGLKALIRAGCAAAAGGRIRAHLLCRASRHRWDDGRRDAGSMGQQHRHGRLGHDVAGGAAADNLAQADTRVGALHDHVAPEAPRPGPDSGPPPPPTPAP